MSKERGEELSVVAPLPKGNLPLEVSSFVGREEELAEVGRLLAGAHVLTLVGAGGSGKTRLALRAAREATEGFADGAWLVELAPLADPSLVPEAVAGVLGVREQAGLSTVEALTRYLQDRELLLLLDNCEHLVDACAALVDALLHWCPRLRVLATSREALRVDGERVWTVPPLAAPDPESSPDPDALGRNEAVGLFVERASAVAPAFALGAENAAAVASVCVRLDGLPLAIELAAARTRVLSVAQISSRLDDCFSLLTDGGRTALPRHKTLGATMDWSHDLLSEGEQALFRRLAVFAGGWTLSAAEEVCAGDGFEASDTLDLLTHLVDRSLVLVAAEGGSQSEEARYRMLEPVRQYASEKLMEVGEAEEIRHRHAAFCLALAEEAELGLEGARQAAWLERLDEEHDNIRSALSWSLEQDDEVAGTSLRMGAALGEFWYLRGYLDEGRRWLEEALQKAGRTPTAARASALQRVSWLAVYQGDLDRAENAGEEGLALEGVDLFQTRGGDSIVAELQRALGLAAAHRGEFERERRFFEESLELSREAGNVKGVANSLLRLGMMWRGQGDFGRATELLEEALALCRESGDPALLASILIHLGCTFFYRSDLERATALSEEAAAMLREQKHRAYLAMALDYLGWAALLGDDSERASALYAEGLELQREVGDKPAALESLGGLACVAGARGETGRAARLFGAAQKLRELMGLRQELGDRALQEPFLAAARSRLDDASWEAAFAEGSAMSFESAVEYALAIEDHPVASTVPAQPSAPERPAGLTVREVEVLRLVASGMSSARVAEVLFVSPRTVDTHLTSIYRKLGVSSRAGATRFALEYGLA
jgi:predicted ATPase/DNA-binding CsgD family transcriptional regulator